MLNSIHFYFQVSKNRKICIKAIGIGKKIVEL
jgi:hypothetical protein